MPRVVIPQDNTTLDVAKDRSILEVALEVGVNYPFGCHSGTCGACKSRLLSGRVRLGEHSPIALTQAEETEGWILACCAFPQTDCVVAYRDDAIPSHPLRKLTGRVIELAQATHDIRIVRVHVQDGPPLAFSAGQFASLRFLGAPPRDYSMANRPDQEILEFHVRLVRDGIASSVVHQTLAVGDAVMLQGPYGASYLRRSHPGSVLAVAGGSGLAPIMSIVETALVGGMVQPLILYFGVRAERDLYYESALTALAGAHSNFRYVIVLSEPGCATHRRTGFLADALAGDLADLRGWKTYLAGPPAMVETVSAVARRLGVAEEDIHADAFFTAADIAARTPPGMSRH